MSSVHVRKAVAADAEGIARVYMQSAEHHAAIDPDRYYLPDPDWIAERYRTGGQHPNPEAESVTFAAEAGGIIVGFVDARMERLFDPMHRPLTYCYVAEIAVDSGHRGQRIGGALMAAAEDWGRQRGADLVSLEYNARNPRAAAFYARLGYQPGSVVAIKRV